MLLSLLLTISFARCFALYSSDSDVVELNPGNFNKLVMNSDEVWIVEFFAPWCGHCQELVPVYKEAARVLKGVVRVGAINGEKHQDLSGRFGVKTLPTVKIFGASKNKPTDYKGERTAQGLAESALAAVNAQVNARLGGKLSGSSKDVQELTDDNFEKLVLLSEDMWLVGFFAPWCQHCKAFTPHWARVATSLKGKVKVGALDVTVHPTTAATYNIKSYPTIKYFPPGPKDINTVEKYEGPFNGVSIVDWALEKLADNVQPPKLQQIVSGQSFKEVCEEKLLCIVSVLPHILDCQSDCRNEYLETLRTVAEKHKHKMWGWAWIEAGAQPHLEKAVNIGGFGYPTVAAINAKKLKYSILRGSFSTTGIDEFLKDVNYGRSTIAHLEALPEISENKLWDGRDGKMPVEEDFDVSDVDMDEKDEL